MEVEEQICSSPLSSLVNSTNNSPIRPSMDKVILNLNNSDEVVPDSEEEEEDEEEAEVSAALLLDSHQSKRVKLDSDQALLPTSITTTTIEKATSILIHLSPTRLVTPPPPSPSIQIPIQSNTTLPLSLPSPYIKVLPTLPTLQPITLIEDTTLSASQEMSWFLKNVDPNELDFLPSSDPAPDPGEFEQRTVKKAVTGQSTVDVKMVQAGGENQLKRKLESIEVDDSGYFDVEDLELAEETEEVKELSPLEVDGLEKEFTGDDEMWAGLDDADFDLLVTGGIDKGKSVREGSNQYSDTFDSTERFGEEQIPEGFVVGFGRAGGNSLRGASITRDFSAPTFTSAPSVSGSFIRPTIATELPFQSSPSTNFDVNLPFAGFSSLASKASDFKGFTSGRGAVVGLSDAALERARKIVLGDSPPLPMNPPSSPAPRPILVPLQPLEQALLSLKAIPKKCDQQKEVILPLPTSIQSSVQELRGFTSGNGKALVEPSAESMKRSEGLWKGLGIETSETKDQDVFLDSATNQILPLRKQSTKSVPNSYRLPTSNLSRENDTIDSPLLVRARSTLIEVVDERVPLVAMENLAHSSSPVTTSVNQTGVDSDLEVPKVPTSSNLIPVVAQSTPLPSRNTAPHLSISTSRSYLVRSSTPLASTSKIPIPSSVLSKSTTNYRSFKPPLLSNASTSNVTPMKSTPAMRKLNIGMTPRTGTNKSKVHKFVTPFKDGVRPVGLTPGGVGTSASVGKIVSDGRVGGRVGGIKESVKGKEKEVKREREDSNFKKLFDLTPPPNRQSLFENIKRPQLNYYEDLLASGLPEELLCMDSVSSNAYVFSCGRGEVEAFEHIQKEGGTYVTQDWITNHWSLIIWKYAGLVRTQPDLLDTYWNWEAVLNQLKYRYEREINNVQRSCIQRIQEQDSPSTLPMILTVSQVRWEDPPHSETLKHGEEPLMIIVGLELTDGWYRIRANIDATLKSACERGKLSVGTKLAISGARIESAREGTEVLKALSRSSINITGNSTSLAPWFSKLGFVQHPFTATLNSLSSSGGVAALVDFVIERIFPSGFIDMNRKTDSEAWCEEEERVRKDQWERGHAKAQARLADAEDKNVGEWDTIIEALQEATEGRDSTISDPTLGNEEADEILERIECSKDQDSIIRRLSRPQVIACLALAQENATEARYQVMADLQEELATSFPPRDVREFKVIRIRDFNKGKASVARTALLTIWEVKTVSNNFLKEGQRYLVSNVVPKGSWTPKTSEIALVTRRDSRWKLVEGEN